MDRSPSFGSIRTSSTPDEDSLSLRLPSAKRLDLLVRITRRIIMQKARPHPPCGRLGLLCKLSVSGLFHSPSGVLFTFPSRYLCTIGFRLVFSLGGWSPQLPIGFHVSDGTRELPPFRRHGCRLQDYHLLWWAVPGPSTIRADETSLQHEAPRQPHNPPAATRVGYHTARVWALARSLAATRAISVDLCSCGY